MKKKEYFRLEEGLPWFPRFTILEKRGTNGDGTQDWGVYGEYCHQDCPQRFLLNFFFERKPSLFKRIFIEEEK